MFAPVEESALPRARSVLRRELHARYTRRENAGGHSMKRQASLGAMVLLVAACATSPLDDHDELFADGGGAGGGSLGPPVNLE